jgi:hypothetical protein
LGWNPALQSIAEAEGLQREQKESDDHFLWLLERACRKTVSKASSSKNGTTNDNEHPMKETPNNGLVEKLPFLPIGPGLLGMLSSSGSLTQHGRPTSPPPPPAAAVAPADSGEI